MNKIVQPQWLEWTKELQFIAQGGLTYSKDVFDIERFERIREITAEMLSLQSEIPIEKVKNLFCNETGFQTPKLDTRAAIFKDDKILLVKEKNGTWSLPGGWVEDNLLNNLSAGIIHVSVCRGSVENFQMPFSDSAVNDCRI